MRKIEFETAKLAKERGFKIGSKASYCEYKQSYNYDGNSNHRESYKKGDVHLDYDFYTVNGVEGVDISNKHYTIYEAPSQGELQDWLLTRVGIFVTVDFAYNEWGRFAASVYNKAKDGITAMLIVDGTTIFDNPFDAMEEGLREALKSLPSKS